MKKTFFTVLATVIVVTMAYFVGVGFYSEKFSANTQFASVDVSNLTLQEAQAKVAEDINAKEIAVIENGHTIATIKVGDLNPQYHTQESLQALYNSQDPSLWVTSLFQTSAYAQELASQVELDESELGEVLADQGVNNEGRMAPTDATIAYDDASGYHVVPGEVGTEIDSELLEQVIVEGIANGSSEVDATQAYAQPEITETSEVITSVMDRINQVAQMTITYEIAGDHVTVPNDRLVEWLHFDANNQMVLDYDGVAAYLSELNEQYSTYGISRQFQSTLQGEVTVPAGILGWEIDVDAEYQALNQDIQSGIDVTREPVYDSTGGVAGAANDIGTSYIEVDLSNQYMYLYVDGVIVVETPIVSGKVGAETVPGANAINEILTNTNLKGYNQFTNKEYSVPVSYWLRFDNNAQGIHDATWQGGFGGNTYQYSGSLGCINTPMYAVETIYNYAEMGMPVIVFY